MSDSVRPETAAFHELETLVRHLGDELSGFRRRALAAEARLREIDGEEGQPIRELHREASERCKVLEGENAALTARLASAAASTRLVLDRVRFLRQQTQISPEQR